MSDVKTSVEIVPGGDLADRINAAHEEVKQSVRSSIGLMIKVGDLLLTAKAAVGHGSFLEWVGHNCTCTPRTAQLYMKLATNRDRLGSAAGVAGSDTKSISHLTLTEAMKMLGPLKQELPKDKIPKKKVDPVGAAIAKEGALTILQRAWVATPDPLRRQFIARNIADGKPGP